MKPKEFSHILQKYIDGICTEEERTIVEKWCDFIAEKERKTIAFPHESKARIYEKIIRTRSAREERPAGKIRYFGMADAVAAALVIMAFLLVEFRGVFSADHSKLAARESNGADLSVVINNSDAPMKTLFEDGTEVTLEPKSKLSGVHFSAEVRKLTLEGKAFFNVARNPKRPFYIYTQNITTRVLGTSFVIDAQAGGEERVEVKTGKVAVYKKETEVKSPDSFVTLTPNLQVHYSQSRKTLIPSIVEHPAPILAAHEASEPVPPLATPSATPAASPKMEFAGARIAEVFSSIETAYGIKIKYAPKLGDCVMTITLIDEDLYTRLRAICAAIGASYKIDGTEILIENGGC